MRAVGDFAKRTLNLKPLESSDQLVGLAAFGFFKPRCDGLDHGVAHHRTQPGVILVFAVIGQEKGFVLGRLNAIPGVAGHDPAVRRFVAQRVQVLWLAGQHADHLAALKQATDVALAHKLGQISPEQHIENRVWPGIGQRLHHAAGVQLAERRRLLGHKLHIRLRRLEQLLESGYGRLAILIVGVHHSPALFLELDGFWHQHGCLHVGARAQAVGVFVAAAPDDFVGQRFTCQEKEFLLFGEIGDCQAGVGQESTGQHINLLTRNQLFGHPHRVARVGVVVARDQLDLFTVDTARRVDFFHRQVHAFLVRLQKGGLGLVAVELADFDHALRMRA